MRGGSEFLEKLFPVWLDHARRNLTRQFLVLTQDFNNWPDPHFPPFNEAQVSEFIAWLEQKGLLAAHMSVPAIMDYGDRPDRDADVGVAVYAASLATWVEHICNEILGTQWMGENTLEHKLPDCWSRHPGAVTFRSAWGRRFIPRAIKGLEARVTYALAVPPADRMDWMARDARLAQIIRNESLHQGLSALSRHEAYDATRILLRAAMGVWLVGK